MRAHGDDGENDAQNDDGNKIDARQSRADEKRRVTRPAVLNLSMLENEKLWMFSYIAFLKLRAKPAEALAPYFPPMTPQKREKQAATTIQAPMT